MQAVEAGLLGDVLEVAATLIEEELDAAVLSDEHVGQAVVVDVADRHAHAVAGDVQAGAGADVLEATAGKLVEELVAGAVRAAVLQQINVEEAVAVEVEQSGPRADDLRHEVAARGAGVVDEVQADLVRHVLEPARIGRRRDDGRGFLAPGDEKKQESKGEKEKRRKGNEEKLKSLWFHPVSLFPFLHHFSSMLCVWAPLTTV